MELGDQRPPAQCQDGEEHSSEWRWAVQQTTRQRVIARRTTVDDRGKRAVQSPTKGAECRPSRQRLSDEAFPATQKSGHTRGPAEFTTMPRSATTNQRNHALEETASSRAERGGVRRWGWGLADNAKHASESAETNTWVSTWTGEGTLKQSFGGSAARRPKRKHDEPEQTSARSREAEQSKV